ncbi:DUF808 domain-containing protein [Hydromonas duriensis]|uniref:DUF808 domain-containing protein n=1 Tax=Hydromonas duriensis TaxID=1527608 RepID=A0A4R6Y7A0_9BURK|nr:DUF808 domain-containing protein [Hydromonas duriensis]TDR31183.1 hypothetical protein DFR44_11252 [Hydromonas duriensis]
MASGSLLALLDDIVTIMDDVGAMTKVAATKTSGVLGDDLALNAQQVAGVNAERELPVVWAVAKGSFVNKLILVPLALALSAFAPAWVLTALLMVGGAYLCFEGFEKVAHKLLHSKHEDDAHHDELIKAIENEDVDMVQFEKDKIKGAIRTDFVLSAEIIVITLGTVAAEPFVNQLAVLSAIAVIMTVGVYGLVAGIVKMDDVGFYLSSLKGIKNAASRKTGAFLLWFAPRLMQTLTVVGTAAMFMVGGGIIAHGLPFLHHFVQNMTANMSGMSHFLTETALNLGVGFIAGAVVLLTVKLLTKVFFTK